MARSEREAPSWAHLDVDSSFDSSGTETSTLLSPSPAPLKLLPMTGFPTPDSTLFPDKRSVEYFEEKSRQFACVIEAQRGPKLRTAMGDGVVKACWYEPKHTNKTIKLREADFGMGIYVSFGSCKPSMGENTKGS